MSRDLKADYRELWSRLNESWEDWNDFKIAHGEHWLERAIAEKERADFLESEVEEYSEKYLSLYRDFATEKERSEQLESLVRELAEVLQLYENWDELVAIRTERNKVLHKAKEVLDNE